MHEVWNRAAKASQGHRRKAVALLFFAACVLAGSLGAAAATPPLASSEITSSLPLPEAPYEQRDFLTRPGTEGFELAARLEEAGGLITRPISWRLYRLLNSPNGGGELVFDGEAPILDLITQPGDYRIDIEYGLARFSRVITLEPQHRLSIAFTLNIGGLRVLSRITSPVPVKFRTDHRIYALTGSDRMRLVAENAVPGDLLRLPAGRYRVESLLSPGNVIARSDIEVKPGVMSAVEIDHNAGIASLALEGTVASDVKWQIVDQSGHLAATADGVSQDVVLSPGDYRIEVGFGAATLSRSITISAGKRLQVVFP
jgi:hypothetical protein